jgi:catechol 2,3-dioxygenase-like lactoylglutathione lyase family enzyme
MLQRLLGTCGVLLLVAMGGRTWHSEPQSPVLGRGQGIDHVGVAVRDLKATEQIYRDRLGFTIGDEGKHPGGTANAGVGFSNHQYLELITVYDRKLATGPAAAMIASFLDKHEGAVFLGLQASPIDQTAAYLRGRGFDVVGPTEGTWIPDGMKETPPAGWKSVSFKNPPVPGGRIFFIEYINKDYWKKLEEKYPNLREDPAKKIHANGALGLRAVWMSVKDLDEATKAYEAVGLVGGARIPLPAIGATAQEIRAGSNGTILLVSPAGPDGATARFLSDRGESVMGVSIEVQSLAKAQSVLKTGLQQDLAEYSGPYGKSLLVPGESAAGAWIEFFEKGK